MGITETAQVAPASYGLRPVRAEDSAVLLAGRNAPQVHPYLFSNHVITPQEHEAWFARRLAGSLPMRLLTANDVPLGVVSLTQHDAEHNRGEWSFYIWADPVPRGAGTCMLAAFLDELFLSRGLRKLGAQVLAGNERSLRLHRKLGFRDEGVLRAHVVKGQEPCDAVVLGLLAQEWRQRRAGFAPELAHVTRQD